VLRRWCEEVGRDEAEIERTLMGGEVILRDTVAEARRAAAEVGRHHPGWEGPEIATTPERLAEELAPYLEIGFRHIYIDFPAPFDEETMERVVTEVKPLIEERAASAVS
jgi:alkanesulfonate monooxygenase SsuD/methylene tetrahydromethanopterin reductase-like flavin-dependent oxidoreductase (luciferase family)